MLTGHSLGGSLVASMMARSKSIRDNTKKATTFNAGSTALFNKEISKDLTKEDKKDLKKKLLHHHVKGDVISASLTMGPQVGKVKTEDGKSASKHSLDNFHQEKSLKDKPDEVPPEQE